MKKLSLNIIVFVALCALSNQNLLGQPPKEISTPSLGTEKIGKFPPRFYVAPAQDGFANFLSAAFLENRLPIQVTVDEAMADYIVVGSSAKGQNKWYDTVFGVEKDRNQGSIKIIRVWDKVIIWASASGDKSFWFSEFKSMGQSKVANRLARKLKKDLVQILAASDSVPPPGFDRKAQSSEILRKEAGGNNRAFFNTSGSDGTNAESHNLTGVTQFQQANYVGAEVSFRQATIREPQNASYHYNLGTALNAMGFSIEAEKEIELATRLAPTEEVYRKNLDLLRNTRKTQSNPN